MAAYGSVPPIGKQSKHSHMARTAEIRKAGEMMIETNQHYTHANVPLKGEHLRQQALMETMFPGRLYYLPKIVPGQEAFVYDADEWQTYNGMDEYPFYGREIMKARR